MKYCCTTAGKILAFTILVFISGTSVAQVTSLSPYSRFGIGTIAAQGSVPQLSMGGMSSVCGDRFSVNSQNPATYPYLFKTTFQFGGKGTFLELSDATESQWLSFASLTDLNFVFKRQGGKGAVALGLAPYSTTGYSITETQEFEDIGTVNYTYDGDGGVNKAHLGIGRRIEFSGTKGLLDEKIAPDSTLVKHHLSLGVNANFFFGSLNQTRRVLYDDATFLHTRITSETSIYDMSFEAGLYGSLNLTNRFESGVRVAYSNLIYGATYTMGGDMSTRFEEITESVQFFSNVEIVVDTINTFGTTRGSITIPEKIGGGLGYQVRTKGDREFKILGDYKTQDWSKFRGQFEEETDTSLLVKASSIALGFEYTPRPISKAVNPLQGANIRVGFRMSDTYLEFDGYQIQEMAGSFGISVPLLKSRSTSKINLGMEFGSRGTTDQNLIQERFVNAYIGFSLSPHVFNNWFIERKYD
jgi:hypothetical protein